MKPIVFALAILVNTLCISHAQTLQLANGEWPPYQSAYLPRFGFASAVVSEAAALGGLQVRYSFYPWKRAEEMVRSGHIDGSLIWSQTPLRDSFALFSEPIVLDREIIIHHAGKPLPDWPLRQQWQGVHLALPLGSRTFHELVRLEREGKVAYHRVENPENGLRMILAGRMTAMTMDSTGTQPAGHAAHPHRNRPLPPDAVAGAPASHRTVGRIQPRPAAAAANWPLRPAGATAATPRGQNTVTPAAKRPGQAMAGAWAGQKRGAAK